MIVVIDIPDYTYYCIKSGSTPFEQSQIAKECICKGKTIPDTHGRLVDLDKMIADFLDGGCMEIGEEELNKIKTIIPASS